MEFKHERRTNTAYVKTLDLELSGNQINLSERPKSKDSSPTRKKLVRSLRPCTLRRPMSATPSFGYRGSTRSRRLPPWSRPQSAEGSAGLRRSKLAAKFSDSSLLDPDYCPEFGATYTLSSSQLLNSLMGSCSINEGLDSDSTPALSPQPSLGDTIKAAAQLEPGLTSKPPLPPTPSPQARGETLTADDIINLKFQRWFPDAVLESEIVSRTSLVVTPFEKQKEETDHSDDGGSVMSGAPLSDRNETPPPPVKNVSTFVKKMRTPTNGDEESKEPKIRFDDSKTENSDSKVQKSKSPKIVIHEPDLYGCDVVTEEFVSDINTRCLTPDYIASFKKSSDFVKDNNFKRLSLSDLSDGRSPSNLDVRSYSGNVLSESDIKKDYELNARSVNSVRSCSGIVHSEINIQKDNEHNNISANSFRSYYGKLHSESDIKKDNEHHDKSANSLKPPKEYSDSDLLKVESTNLNSSNSLKPLKEYSDSDLLKVENTNLNSHESNNELSLSRNEVGSPFEFETSASKYRLTSTPITNENILLSSSKHDDFKSILTPNSHKSDQECKRNDSNFHKVDSNTMETDHKIEDEKCNTSVSPPIRLRSEEDEVYHDHLRTYKTMLENQELGSNANKEGFDKYPRRDNDKNRPKRQEKHAHFSTSVKSIDFLSPVEPKEEQNKIYKETKTEKPVHQSGGVDNDGNGINKITGEYRNCTDKNSNSAEERMSDDETSSKIYQLLSKHRSGEKGKKTSSQKSQKRVKEFCRAASVPPFPNSKLSLSNLKQASPKNGSNTPQTSKKKVRRSMSYDAAVSPDIPEKDSGVSSYEDIVTMIKVLEKEDLESPVLKYKTSSAVDNLAPAQQSSSAKAILNFLDEVEKGTLIVDADKSLSLPLQADESARSGKGVAGSSRLGALLTADAADLAQQVMTLTLQLEEAVAASRAADDRYQQSVELLRQQQGEHDEASRRQQTFIDQLLKEKRHLAVQYETAIKELEAKHETAIKVIEERHKVEMKKAQDKFNAAEKIRRDKWIDAKTKKIKELTVKGLEPELERMSVTHQQEIAELRRAHQRHLEEAEAAWNRRMTALREQEASERQTAILHEREAARHRLEQEMNQVEKSYQEQRRRLLEEVREEKELLHRQSERLVAEKQVELAKQVEGAKKKVQDKMVEYDKKHQEEVAKLRECLETEKTAWVSRQRAALEEKEVAIKEELKRERDRHIELAIRRLETEAGAREQAIENKLKRLKESYDAEVSDLDSTLKELRSRLKDVRAELQKSEDANAVLRAQLGQAHNELIPLKQTLEKLRKESNDALQQSEAKTAELQRELAETKQSFQEQVNKIHNEKERQLQQVYTRVKEAINKKEEALVLVTKQRDAALEQCARLEKLLENQRAQALKL